MFCYWHIFGICHSRIYPSHVSKNRHNMEPFINLFCYINPFVNYYLLKWYTNILNYNRTLTEKTNIGKVLVISWKEGFCFILLTTDRHYMHACMPLPAQLAYDAHALNYGLMYKMCLLRAVLPYINLGRNLSKCQATKRLLRCWHFDEQKN